MSLLLFILLIIYKCNGGHWSYKDINAWNDEFKECGGKRQSPIDITTEVNCNKKLHLNWNVNRSKTLFQVVNNGHSLAITPIEMINNKTVPLTTNKNTIAKLKNPLPNKDNAEYCLAGLHFHWGAVNSIGSEHTIKHNRYPLEIHFVHYKCKYNNINDAQNAYKNNKDINTLSVISVLVNIGDSNKALKNIVLNHKLMNKVDYYNNNANGITSFTITDLMPGYETRSIKETKTEIYGYYGSLTTPPCYETVIWQIMKETITASNKELNEFREMYFGNKNTSSHLQNNYRTIQNLNNRQIYECNNINLNSNNNNNNIGNNIGNTNDNNSNNNNTNDISSFGMIIIIILVCILVLTIISFSIYIGILKNKNDYSKINNAQHTDATVIELPKSGDNN